MNTPPPEQPDRRIHHQVREVFVSACNFLAPVVAGNDYVLRVSNYAMMHMLQDRYPALSQSDIHIVIATVEKIHRNERIRSLLK